MTVVLIDNSQLLYIDKIDIGKYQNLMIIFKEIKKYGMASAQSIFLVGEDWLTVSKAMAIAAGEIKLELTAAKRKKVQESAQTVANIVAKGQPFTASIQALVPYVPQKFRKKKPKYYRPIFSKATV